MGLQITLPTQYGVNATYHRITRLNLDYTVQADGVATQPADFIIASYVDQASRETGNQPLFLSRFILDSDQFNQYLSAAALATNSQNPQQAAYAFAKTVPPLGSLTAIFSTATDN